MSTSSLLQYGLFCIILFLLVRPIGIYVAHVMSGHPTLLDPLLGPLERLIYRACGIDEREEMGWQAYAVAMLVFSLGGTLGLYALLRLQPWLHLPDPSFQPQPLAPDLAFNTAISFVTTTTWQAYSGEVTMSYASQMVGLVVQNFLAGATGLAVGMAFIRGFVRERCQTVGNFWVDLTRATLWILLPGALVGALALVWQGVPANFLPYQAVPLLQAQGDAVIPQGPVAALEFIKNLGTNGGGFFNTNAAHPYENPTPLSNLLELLAIAAIPAALPYTFGYLTKARRMGWLLCGVMSMLFVAGMLCAGWAEQAGNPHIAALGVDQQITALQPGGNMEGKETRFGVGGSALATVVTSNGATGSYNAMHDSYTPLGGAVPLVNMLLGEVIFGGLGTGLYSMLFIVMIAVFLGGLMVGRTPALLGKQLGATAMKLVMLTAVLAPASILLLSALAVCVPAGLGSLYRPAAGAMTIFNPGPHGLTEVVFAYASAFANNGQNFAGLGANTPFYNITLALAMMLGRFGLAIPALALAGHLAAQQRRADSDGVLRADSLTFGALTVAVILIMGLLNFLPVLALGPLVEHLLMAGG